MGNQPRRIAKISISSRPVKNDGTEKPTNEPKVADLVEDRILLDRRDDADGNRDAARQ